MKNEVANSRFGDAGKGLPPVKPPSGRFIVQLFLIPGLIVLCLVLVFLFGGMAWVGSTSPQSILQKLDNSNPDVRWRGASDLAQVLHRPESIELASNVDFALDIAVRLQSALAELEQAEKTTKRDLGVTFQEIDANKKLTPEQKVEQENQEALKAWRKLRPQRDLVFFLTSSMGHFVVPVGVHVLSQIALEDQGAEIKGTTQRRRIAVFSLANLGQNMQQRYFGRGASPVPADDAKPLTSVQKEAIVGKLASAAEGSGVRAKLALYAFEILEKKQPHKVDAVLEACSRSDDIFLRELVAFALNFWDGDRVEPTLVKLAHDDGHGTQIQSGDVD